jgi:mannose-6-phosphate isomerase
MAMNEPLALTPEYRDYVWGGSRLKPGFSPIAEAWVVSEQDVIAAGQLQGRTLSDVTKEYGVALLGTTVVNRTGLLFPLLIKLLDCAAWLSLQVHPNDEQATRLEGPGLFGKTEAWQVLDAVPGAKLIAGLVPGTSAESLSQSIRNGTVLEKARYLQVRTGDTVFIRPGTIHALGPGLLVYEVQQTSNCTYRVFDWNRPQTGGRVLHIEKSLAVADPSAEVKVNHATTLEDGEKRILCQCPYFTLETMAGQTREFALDTRGETFHALTVIEGSCTVITQRSSVRVNLLQSVLIPASCGHYRVKPDNGFRMLKAGVE